MPPAPGNSPSPSFEQPLAVLSDCHRRLERCLHVLERFATRPAGAELGAHDRELLAVTLRFFREALPKHTTDEEESLFPRLRQATHPLAIAAMHRLAALESDHAAAQPRQELMEALGQRWLIAGCLGAGDQELFRRMVTALAEMYAQHLALEEQEVFPLAARILSPGALRSVGREMAARRGWLPVRPVQSVTRSFPARSRARSHALQAA